MAFRGYRYLKGGRRGAILFCCLLASASARGQSLDYGRLETLFGEPVTMSATGKPERLSDTPATMDIITQDDIKRSGARDLATLLRLVPGIPTYRGFNGNGAFSIGAILLNGREVYLSAFNQTFLNSLPVELEEIRQIEVVRGPQSALYGFASADGVINIITFDPAQDTINYVRGRGGNGALREAAGSLTINPADGVGVRLTAAQDHRHEDDLTPPTTMRIAPENQERRSFDAQVSANLADGGHAGFEVAHSDVSVTTTVPQATLGLNARFLDDAVKADYTTDTGIGRIGALVSYTALSVPEAATYLNGYVNLHDHTSDGRLNDLVKLSPDDSVRAELEIRQESVHSAVSPQPVNTFVFAGSGMWDHRFGSSLSMVNAIRYSLGDISQTGPGLLGGDYRHRLEGVGNDSSLIWKIDGEESFRATFARGLSLPSQLGFAQLGLAAGNPKGASLASGSPLNPWTSTEDRLTYDRQFRDWGVWTRLSLFRQQSEDLQALQPLQLLASTLSCANPTPRILATCRALTSGTALSGLEQGLEFEIEHKSKTGLTWGFNYAIEKLRPHATAPSEIVLPGIGREETVQKANAHVGYGWGDWSADLRALYTSPTPTLTLDTLSRTPHVAVEMDQNIWQLSPRIGWQVSDFATIEASAENLWPYRLNALQRIDSSYFLTLRVNY